MSTSGKLYYNDQSRNGVLSGGSWNASFPLTNMQESRLSLVARSTDLTFTSTKFTITFTANITTEAIFLIGTNLDVNAEWRVTAFTASPGSPDNPVSVYDSSVRSFWPSGVSSPDQRVIRDPDHKGMPLFALLGQTVTASIWQVELFNTTNAVAYIEIARLFMGTRLSTTRNFATGASFTRDPNTQTEKALGGALFFNRHKNIRSWNFLYPHEDYATAWDEIDTMSELCGINDPLFVVPFPDDVDRIQKHSFLCTISQMNALEMMAAGETRVSTGFSLREII